MSNKEHFRNTPRPSLQLYTTMTQCFPQIIPIIHNKENSLNPPRYLNGEELQITYLEFSKERRENDIKAAKRKMLWSILILFLIGWLTSILCLTFYNIAAVRAFSQPVSTKPIQETHKDNTIIARKIEWQRSPDDMFMREFYILPIDGTEYLISSSGYMIKHEPTDITEHEPTNINTAAPNMKINTEDTD